VDYMDEDGNEVLRAIQLSREKKPLGILFLGGNHQNFLADFHHISLPCVLVTNSAADLPFPNLSSVSSDDILAARTAVGRLAEMGHREIAVIGGSRSRSDTTKLRYRGCLEAFREYGIPFDEARSYETARFTYADGYRAAQALLARKPDMTALFAMSDVMAIGAIRGLMDLGKRVPEDISVIGFDGLAIGEYMIPRLSTISQSVEELAERSLALLSRSFEGETTPRYDVIPVTFLKKESVRTLSV